jgi:hypothetical protein
MTKLSKKLDVFRADRPDEWLMGLVMSFMLDHFTFKFLRGF